jgi:hypothetical protein
MLKREFEERLGMSVDPACYDHIAFVYTHCPLFSEVNGKQEIADFYKRFEMNGIERLYHALKETFALMKEDKSYGEPWQVLYEYAASLFQTEASYKAYAVRARPWQLEYKFLVRTGQVG